MASAPTPASSARVQTDRAGRYGKQLAAHLGRRAQSAWDDNDHRGTISFGSGRADLEAIDDALLLSIWVNDDDAPVERLEDVVGRHLVRFGARDELVVRWIRADGAAGSEQRGVGDEQPRPERGESPSESPID